MSRRWLVLFLALLVSSGGAADCLNYGDYLHLLGSVHDSSLGTNGISYDGTYAYVSGFEFRVVDVSDPCRQHTVASLDLFSTRTVIAGDYAYVLGFQRLYVMDISVPAATHVVADVPTLYCGGIAVVPPRVYLVGRDPNATFGFLQVLDISQPAQPQVMGMLQLGGSVDAGGVAVRDGLAYVAFTDYGLRVINVANPAHPFLLGGVYIPLYGASAVTLVEDLACVASFEGVRMIDIADPAYPVLRGYVDTGGYPTSVVTYGGYVLASDLNMGIRVIDPANPQNPRIVGSVAMNDSYAVAIQGQRACVGAAGAIGVIDIANPLSPPLVGWCPLPHLAWDVAIVGDLACGIGPDYGLAVIDVSDAASAHFVGQLVVPQATAVVAVAHHACLVAADNGLQIVDLAQPACPQIVASLELAGYVRGLTREGSLIYVAVPSFGLQVVDVADPQAPHLIGSLGLAHGPFDVAIANGHAFVAGYRFFGVVDVTDPAAPHDVATIDLEEYAWSLAVAGDYAYVAVCSRGLMVIEVSDPGQPRIVGCLEGGGEPQDVVVAGDRVYVATYGGGIQIFDISDPAAPRPAGSQGTQVDARAVVVDGDNVYSAANVHGLQILARQCGEPATGVVLPSGVAAGIAMQAEPNPAARQSTLRFALAASARVTVTIYDLAGRTVRRLFADVLGSGAQALAWDGRDDKGQPAAAGVYLARVATATGSGTSRVVIVR
jgi:hypothetical protein